jgi:predicted phosphodiesterase
MECQVRRILYKPGSLAESDVMIEPIGDIHVGARFHDKPKFAEVVKRIAEDPRRLTIIMGDLFDATLPDNKFYDQENQDPELPTIQSQYDYLYKMLKPISHKILGIHTGNHDERIRLRHYQDMVLRLCMELDIPKPVTGTPNAMHGYLGYLALSRFQFVSENDKSGSPHVDEFDFFTTHGYYNGRRIGGNMNQMEDLAGHFSADVYLAGHTHQMAVHKKVKKSLDGNGNLEEIVKVFGVTGSFARAYNAGFTSYPEKTVMPTSRVGTITIGINPRQRKLHAYE